MNKFYQIIVCCVSALIFGCSAVQVSQDYDTSRTFSGLRTYAWKTVERKKTGDVRRDNPLLHNRIRTAVEQSLAVRGFKKISKDRPDFFVDYQYTIRSKIESDDVRTGVGFGVGRSGHFGGIGVSTGTNVNEYDQGMLVIDIIEPGTDTLMWRGIGTRRVSVHSKPEKITQNVHEMVEKILNQFPPAPKVTSPTPEG